MNQRESFNQFFSTQLNHEQQQAVAQKNGSLLIIAGAGSGKTRVITSRIINLMLNENVAAHAIIALTFTNKAASEMKERIATLLGTSAKPFIGTFHSYCLHLLRTNPHLAPHAPFAIIDADDQQSMLQKLIKQAHVEKKVTAKTLGYQISLKKNSGNYHADFSTSSQEELFEQLYAAYEKEKKINKVIDFDDLLLEVNTLFAKNEWFKEQFQATVRHILVDEYQDTNHVQHALLKHMALKNGDFQLDSLCVVGDEDQSIYSWRGATVANIMQFTNDFPDTVRIKIEQNYRSVQPILKIANHVIEHNTYRNPKKIWSEKDASDRARIITCLSGYQEGEACAHLVASLQKAKKPHTVAVLYRAHYQSRIIEEALIRHSIPYTIIGGIQFYERKEIKDILAYLRLIANPFDRISFFRIVNVPHRGFGKKFEETFEQEWQQEPLFTFPQIAQKLIKAGTITGKKAVELMNFIALLQSFSFDAKPLTCINTILANTHYFTYLKEIFDPEEAESKIENIKELLRAVAHFEEQGSTSVGLLLQEITLMQEKIAESKKQQHEHVQLMTLHAAKGLEFDVVALTGLEEGLFPSMHALYENARLEEERRLLYVGITRAREYILFSHARYRYTFGTMNDQVSSRFLDEIPAHLAPRHDASGWDSHQFPSFFSQWLHEKEIKKASSIMTFGSALRAAEEKNSQKEEKTAALREKQSVRHTTFGLGIIKQLERKDDATMYATVQFKAGIKKIKADFLKPA